MTPEQRAKLARPKNKDLPQVKDYKKNLYQYTHSPEEVRENCLKAGLATREMWKRRKLQREILGELMTLKCDDKEAVAALEALGLPPDFATAANLAIVRRALKGEVEAMKYIRDTLGEKPADVTQLNLLDRPVAAQDLSQLSDAELEVLADRADRKETAVALPEGELQDE